MKISSLEQASLQIFQKDRLFLEMGESVPLH